MAINDAHCHFFSSRFFATLGSALKGGESADAAGRAIGKLGWEPPGSAEQLADRWAAELDRHGVARAALIASVPGDGESVAIAVRRHPRRFVGFFMVDPTGTDAAPGAAAMIDQGGLRAMCLFPAMHRYPLHDERVRRIFDVAAARPGTAVFVHCGVLSVGVRQKLGLPSPFDIRFGNPLDLHAVALSYPVGADHHSALWRGALPRSADGRGPVPERAPRHVELEWLDEIPRRPHARHGTQAGGRGGRSGPDSLRHRLVVLPARMGQRRVRAPGQPRSTKRASGSRGERRSSGATSTGCFQHKTPV